MLKIAITTWIFFTVCDALFEGDTCAMVLKNGGNGKCTNIHKCSYVKILILKHKISPPPCGFNGTVPLVCCPDAYMRSRQKVSRSEKKCEEYHNLRFARTTIAHGLPAKANEFPHMAALGYGNNHSDISWLCGGSLISDRFVLTAAHCTKNINYGDPKWARLGDLNLKTTQDDVLHEDFVITDIHVHPDYKWPSHYNDLALLKLGSSVKFGRGIKPACLHTQKELPNDKMQAIGWGTTGFLGESSDHLLKAFLNVIEHRKCAEKFVGVSGRKLAQGIREDLQVCAGDASGKDTCPGDSGGPLHFLQPGNLKMGNYFVIVGITSFGKGCGFEDSVGVYTRVSAYREWIEHIVWPIN